MKLNPELLQSYSLQEVAEIYGHDSFLRDRSDKQEEDEDICFHIHSPEFLRQT